MLKYTVGANELAEYYSSPVIDVEPIRRHIKDAISAFPENMPICHRKIAIQRIMTEECPVKVFPHFPFFFEVCCGRPRTNWGVRNPLASLLVDTNSHKWMVPYSYEVNWFREAHLFHGGSPVSYDHHCPPYDNILSKGCEQLIIEANEAMLQEKDPRKKAVISSFASGAQLLCDLAARFADTAENMAQTADLDDSARSNLARIAYTALTVPRGPAETFYEAMACILFIREAFGSLEGIGMSTFGHLDRILYPYYKHDLENGNITREEAYSLIHALLSFTDAKFGINDSFYPETSTTIVLGGCDADGTPVFNEVTRMFVDAELENRYVGTKVIIRLSTRHPPEFFDMLGRFVASKHNVLVMPNDDLLIPANVKYGKKLEDARLYVGGGCHEIVLANTEVNSRADSWINVPQVLLNTLHGRPMLPRQEPANNPQFTDFEDFYNACMANMKLLHDTIASAKTKYEAFWKVCDAAPVYSCFFDDCLAKAMDITAGGARYNSVSLSMVGAATFLDSLFTIKKLIFEEKRLTMDELRKVLDADFQGSEPLLQYIRNRLPKHGENNEEFNAFAARVMEDLSHCSGQPNARGGQFTPAFYPHTLFIDLGQKTDATPDGRRRGFYLSRGFSPSEFIEEPTATDIISSLTAFDLRSFPESFATELTLPCSLASNGDDSTIPAIIKTFVASGGATLQINILDREELLAARREPEKHRNLIVRVCGFSQSFNSLPDYLKDEVISRAERNV